MFLRQTKTRCTVRAVLHTVQLLTCKVLIAKALHPPDIHSPCPHQRDFANLVYTEFLWSANNVYSCIKPMLLLQSKHTQPPSFLYNRWIPSCMIPMFLATEHGYVQLGLGQYLRGSWWCLHEEMRFWWSPTLGAKCMTDFIHWYQRSIDSVSESAHSSVFLRVAGLKTWSKYPWLALRPSQEIHVSNLFS